jgi:hypothetical protein
VTAFVIREVFGDSARCRISAPDEDMNELVAMPQKKGLTK